MPEHPHCEAHMNQITEVAAMRERIEFANKTIAAALGLLVCVLGWMTYEIRSTRCDVIDLKVITASLQAELSNNSSACLKR